MSEKSQNKRTYNKEDVLNLFVRSGGCCTFCKKYLFEEWMTHTDTNIGEKCHIRAFALYGTRGKDKTAKANEINGYQNLVLGCPSCHSGIDKKVIENIITVEKIHELKNKHEETIRLVLSNVKNTNFQIVKYSHPIDKTKISIDDTAIRLSAFNSLRFTDSNIINLSGNELEEGDVESAIKNIDTKYNTFILTKLANNENVNICLYAIGPIYLLIYLGTLLNEKINVVPFILRRNPLRWNFDLDKSPVIFQSVKPEKIQKNNDVALIINTSGKIDNSRLKNTFNKGGIDIWEINTNNMDYDIISTEEELNKFSALFKKTIEEIGLKYGKEKAIHLFPATSNAISVSIGRCFSKKSHNKLIIYDTREYGSTFKKVLEI